MNNNPILDAALAYHAMGLSLLPMHRDKSPALRTWARYQTERANEATLHRWFSKGDKGIGIVLGQVSRSLICRDFDKMDAYTQWAAAHPTAAKLLPTVETARGRHVYARGDVAAIRRTFNVSIVEMADGEMRAGGLAVLPPSIHPTGMTYRWLIPLAGMPPEVDVVDVGFVPCNREGREALDLEHREDRDSRETETTEKLKTLKPVGGCVFETKDFAPEVLEQVRLAIRRTLPTGKAQRHRLVFELARELKAIPAVADAHPGQLKNILRGWWNVAKEFSQTPFEEHFFDFAEGWGKVKFPKGSEPMAMILERAKAGELPEVAQQFEQQPLRLLVALCCELQRATGEGPFYLSSRTAGRLLGIDHTTAHRWLRGLQHEGILLQVEKGSQNPKDRKATRYRYLPAM